jgi:hypothetical protein
VLLLLFVVGWRNLDRPGRLGVAIGLGTVAKIQPIVLVGWAWATKRRRAAWIAIVVGAVFAVLGTIWAGPGAWLDELTLLAKVTAAGAAHDVGVGHLLILSGVPVAVAQVIALGLVGVVLFLMLASTGRVSADASYLGFVVGSQLLSVVLWDHYALVLLAPIAWLLARRVYWAAGLAVATSVPAIIALPDAVYPVVFWVTLLAVLWYGRREVGTAEVAAVSAMAPA